MTSMFFTVTIKVPFTWVKTHPSIQDQNVLMSDIIEYEMYWRRSYFSSRRSILTRMVQIWWPSLWTKRSLNSIEDKLLWLYRRMCQEGEFVVSLHMLQVWKHLSTLVHGISRCMDQYWRHWETKRCTPWLPKWLLDLEIHLLWILNDMLIHVIYKDSHSSLLEVWSRKENTLKLEWERSSKEKRVFIIHLLRWEFCNPISI